MWIARIELTNFKSYSHQVFTFPRPTDGRHVILIGGCNGYGKTTLLEALYLCLYGKDAMPHLARAGISTERGYPSFLERALNGQALAIGRDWMSVSVRMIGEHNEGLQIKRSWYFRSNGDWSASEEVVLHEVRNGNPERIFPDKELKDRLERDFIPAHIAPFFFFDGEEVKKLADQDRVEQVKQGMEGLLGVTLLRKLEQNLSHFQDKQKPEKGATASPSRVGELKSALHRHEEDQRTLKESRTRADADLNDAKGRREVLMNRMMALGGGSGDIATVKEIMEEKGRLKQERESVESELASLLAEKLPFHLMRPELRDQLVAQWTAELERGRWETDRAAMEPKRHRFLESFFSLPEPPLDPGLTEAQESALRERIDIAWQGLFFPVPEGCAEEIVHSWIHDQKRTEALQQFKKLRIGASTILKAVEHLMDLRDREAELDQRLTRVEGLDRDGTLSQIKTELVELNRRIETSERELGDLDRRLTALDATIAQDRATYEREHEKLVRASPAVSNIGKAERVRRLIADLIPRLYALKTSRLSDAMTRVFGRLAHTQWFDRIVIDETGRSRLFSGEVEVSFDRSAGENQLFVTALLAGLAEVSGIQAPLVVDTPLGRLDVTHRENILDFWLSDPERQVILLSQDAEIGEALHERLRPALAKTWLLQREVIGQGVSKTVAYEDCYFDFEATPA